MKIKLRDEDRRAIDLLLDRSAAAAGKATGASVFAVADAAVNARVAPIQKILHLLDAMPAEEPSRNLLARTLRHIERASGHTELGARQAESLLANQAPPA
ncbi:MAG TPA: hypothetical protein VFC78_00325 [Tepidisphaeraceae bacterium]|nr:hypothetical protein [Tepidisphaeraceae bacterium]